MVRNTTSWLSVHETTIPELLNYKLRYVTLTNAEELLFQLSNWLLLR